MKKVLTVFFLFLLLTSLAIGVKAEEDDEGKMKKVPPKSEYNEFVLWLPAIVIGVIIALGIGYLILKEL
jgi:hypothetical protein